MTDHAPSSRREIDFEDFLAELYREVAIAMDLDPDVETIPLGEVIDPEALARMVQETRPDTYISFCLDGIRVTVDGDGEILIEDAIEA